MSIYLKQRSPTPEPQTSNGPWPLRKWAGQQGVSGRLGESSKLLLFPSLPILELPPESPRCPIKEILSSMKLVPGSQRVGDYKSNVLYYSGINCCYCYCYYIKHLTLASQVIEIVHQCCFYVCSTS